MFSFLSSVPFLRNVSAEDVVVVRIALLWTVLLMSERPSLFQAFTSPRDTYVRISEIFLIGNISYSFDTLLLFLPVIRFYYKL